MITSIKLSILVFALLFHQSLSYKPVVLIHGIMTGSGSMELIMNRIEEVRYKLSHNYVVLIFMNPGISVLLLHVKEIKIIL